MTNVILYGRDIMTMESTFGQWRTTDTPKGAKGLEHFQILAPLVKHTAQ